MLFDIIEKKKGFNPQEYQESLNNLDAVESVDELITLFIMTAVFVDYDTHQRLESLILSRSNSLSGEQKYYMEIGRGMIRYFLKNFDECLAHYVIATSIAYETTDAHLIADANRYMSIIYRKLNDLKESSYYIEKSVRALKDVNSPLLYATVYLTYGVILTDMGELEHTLRVYEKAFEYFKEISDADKHVNYVVLILNTFDLYTRLDDAKNAQLYFDKVKDILKTGNFPMYNVEVLKTESRMLKQAGRFEEALNLLEEFMLAKDKLPKYTAGYYKTEIQQVFEQIAILKDKNRSLTNRLAYMYETMETPPEKLNYKLEERVKKAMDRDHIHPFFQLKWSMSQQRFIGAEALIRWIENDKVIPPSEFIHEIENHEMIIPVSELMIHKSMKFCKEVLNSGIDDFHVSINISPYQLANHNLAKFIKNELVFFDLDGRHIEIEVTERSFLEQNPQILEELYDLKSIGIKISLDDFGTGFSSLSCVNDFPIDIIKIDRSLISNIEDDLQSRKLLAGIIRLIKELDLDIVAEGVEKETQVEILDSLRCDCIQGFYFAKPDRAENVIEKLTSYKK